MNNVLSRVQEFDCTGCGACSASCPTEAISMKENIYSELHPHVNENKCMDCHRCIQNCPVISQSKNERPQGIYAAFRTNADKRKKSASGGIGAVLAEKFISTLGGVFYSTTISEGTPIVRECNDIADIENFKGSFYVQSNMGNAYNDIEKELKNGKSVLFIGTPCQVAGLKNCTSDKYNKLYTVDLLCHGVSPAKYLNEYIEFVCKNHPKRQSYTDISFRSNIQRCDYVFCMWNAQEIVYRMPSLFSMYFREFLKGNIFRESCYRCKFKSVNRSGDLSIGDFIGLGKYVHYSNDPTRVSIIMKNTDKGSWLMDLICKEINIEERTLEEALIEGTSLKASFPRTKKHINFKKGYPKIGFVKSVFWADGIGIANDFIKICFWKGMRILGIAK